MSSLDRDVFTNARNTRLNASRQTARTGRAVNRQATKTALEQKAEEIKAAEAAKTQKPTTKATPKDLATAKVAKAQQARQFLEEEEDEDIVAAASKKKTPAQLKAAALAAAAESKAEEAKREAKKAEKEAEKAKKDAMAAEKKAAEAEKEAKKATAAKPKKARKPKKKASSATSKKPTSSSRKHFRLIKGRRIRNIIKFLSIHEAGGRRVRVSEQFCDELNGQLHEVLVVLLRNALRGLSGKECKTKTLTFDMVNSGNLPSLDNLKGDVVGKALAQRVSYVKRRAKTFGLNLTELRALVMKKLSKTRITRLQKTKVDKIHGVGKYDVLELIATLLFHELLTVLVTTGQQLENGDEKTISYRSCGTIEASTCTMSANIPDLEEEEEADIPTLEYDDEEDDGEYRPASDADEGEEEEEPNIEEQEPDEEEEEEEEQEVLNFNEANTVTLEIDEEDEDDQTWIPSDDDSSSEGSESDSEVEIESDSDE